MSRAKVRLRKVHTDIVMTLEATSRSGGRDALAARVAELERQGR